MLFISDKTHPIFDGSTRRQLWCETLHRFIDVYIQMRLTETPWQEHTCIMPIHIITSVKMTSCPQRSDKCPNGGWFFHMSMQTLAVLLCQWLCNACTAMLHKAKWPCLFPVSTASNAHFSRHILTTTMKHAYKSPRFTVGVTTHTLIMAYSQWTLLHATDPTIMHKANEVMTFRPWYINMITRFSAQSVCNTFRGQRNVDLGWNLPAMN